VVINHLCDVTYLHTHQIAAYIKETFKVQYTVLGLNKWLHQHQYSYKQPKGVPHKFDVDKQAAFIEYYEQLSQLKRERVLVIHGRSASDSGNENYGLMDKKSRG
jgi:hypothetical protein